MSGSMLFNLPNMLTLSRIVAIPLVVACFWLDRGWAQWFSMALFVTAAVTDWFDGYFARRYHQISRFGRFLDPIADKLLVAAALVMLVDNSTLAGVNVLAALIILAREILVGRGLQNARDFDLRDVALDVVPGEVGGGGAHVERAVLGVGGELEQGGRGEKPGRAGADDGDVVGTHPHQLSVRGLSR